MPRAMISDQGSHFYNKPFEALMGKYGVTHRVSTAYHPQIMAKLNDQIGNSNQFLIKR